jgi:hypothetical protein
MDPIDAKDNRRDGSRNPVRSARRQTRDGRGWPRRPATSVSRRDALRRSTTSGSRLTTSGLARSDIASLQCKAHAG